MGMYIIENTSYQLINDVWLTTGYRGLYYIILPSALLAGIIIHDGLWMEDWGFEKVDVLFMLNWCKFDDTVHWWYMDDDYYVRYYYHCECRGEWKTGFMIDW